MAAPKGWNIMNDDQRDENSNRIVPGSSGVSNINDYFEEVGDFERKCTLCSKVLRLNRNKSIFNLNIHFEKKHKAEWTELEPFVKKRQRKPKVRQNFR